MDAANWFVGAAHFAFVALAQFVFIFTKSFQQRNVSFNHYVWIIPTSCFMALCEVYVISKIATIGFGFWLVIVLGVSGGLGSLCATLLHTRFLGRKEAA